MKIIDELEMFRNVDTEEKFNAWKGLTRGQKEVASSYISHSRADNVLVDLLVIDHAWSEDMQDIIDYMKALGFDSFIFADTSTECFKSIQALLENNCKLSNVIYKTEKEFNGTVENISGILVEF